MYSLLGLLLLPQNRGLSLDNMGHWNIRPIVIMYDVFFLFVFTRYGTGRIDQNVKIIFWSLAYARLASTLQSTVDSVGLRSAVCSLLSENASCCSG